MESDRRLGLRLSWRRINSLLAANFLLGCMLAGAQSERTLPKAPVAQSVAHGDWQASFDQGIPRGLFISAKQFSLRTERTSADPSASLQDNKRTFVIELPTTALEPVAGESIPNAGVEFAAQGVHLDLTRFFAAMNRPAGEAGSQSEAVNSGRYNVKGLLWQSLAFTGVETAFRMSTDEYMRHLIADGPYWSNYMASMQHWDMTRWSDGDDFVVDEIGHPMQGAVSGFIEIQNGPRQRLLEFGKSKAYWRSRFLALMWATVFSTQQKIGPLGEAALGNAGGYTYVPGCQFPCPSWHPGKTYLNNTGWTDFIMTPVGGTAWVVMEDVLDREVSDRLENRFPNNHVLDNIVRAGLNPARTMANFVRWRNPWYRDFEHYPVNRHITPGIHFIPSDDDAARRAPRFELFPHFAAISLPVNTASCTGCRRITPGYGIGFSARLARWVDFDSDVDYHSNASPLPSDRAGGSATMGTFGLRTGVQYTHYAVKVSLRPGFLSYSHAYEIDPTTGLATTDIGRITHFVTAMGINADYDLSRHFALRGTLGNTPVRYREPGLTPNTNKPPYFNWLSPENFSTNENWTYQTGVVLRF